MSDDAKFWLFVFCFITFYADACEVGVGEFVIVDKATGRSEFQFKQPCDK